MLSAHTLIIKSFCWSIHPFSFSHQAFYLSVERAIVYFSLIKIVSSTSKNYTLGIKGRAEKKMMNKKLAKKIIKINSLPSFLNGRRKLISKFRPTNENILSQKMKPLFDIF